MALLPKALQHVIDALGAIAGVGPRTAERYALYLLKNDPRRAKTLADALDSLHAHVKVCPKTFALIDADEDVSELYGSPDRDKTTVMVIAEAFDILPMEKTRLYKGTYHVLGGLISPIDGIDPEHLRIGELVSRVKQDNVKEVILATNASVEGETTAIYIQQALKDSPIRVTRLARGLPIGVDLEYADQITLSRAFEGRQEF
jgi:recombination protein RecR